MTFKTTLFKALELANATEMCLVAALDKMRSGETNFAPIYDPPNIWFGDAGEPVTIEVIEEDLQAEFVDTEIEVNDAGEARATSDEGDEWEFRFIMHRPMTAADLKEATNA
jgi:hypothetical protein